MNSKVLLAVLLAALGMLFIPCVYAQSGDLAMSNWQTDFQFQPYPVRPELEVRYTDASRTAFEVIAADYDVIGELRAPHRLVEADSGREWLAFTLTDAAGKVWSTTNFTGNSRINLYRRGPYYCEVHWFDLQPADEAGNAAPLKADVALYCYPEKLLVSVTWHAVGDFDAASAGLEGLVQQTWPCQPFKTGDKQTFAGPLFGEQPPLPADRLITLSAHQALRYDEVRGCYMITSRTEGGGGFQRHFYQIPQDYQPVKFSVRNDSRPRKVYICHEGTGVVEGGAVLDSEGHPMPLVVQISKNFAGEKEEKFYNPADTQFDETIFPLYLEPGEEVTLTSLHLHQNWGRHMTKHFSSLGAWMDYYHSSTGITETTCYVPFKFGGLPGVSIADYRAMSQPTFWSGQPQHDNVAGHMFLSYAENNNWAFSEFQRALYHSTGPNWMDIGLDYLTSDEKVMTEVETWELPSADELRNFVRFKCTVNQPISLHSARTEFRLLQIATWVQRLRYKTFACTGTAPIALTFEKNHYAVAGAPLPSENAYITMFDDDRGSNAIILRKFETNIGGRNLPPAAGIWCETSGDTRLFLSVDADDLTLQPGDTITFEAYWNCYAPYDSAAPAEREARVFGSEGPRLLDVAVGEALADFPTTVRAEGNEAEFTIAGGRDVLPIIVTGLTDYRWPRLFRQESSGWTPVRLNRSDALDGVQVRCEPDGSFAAIFLLASDNQPQTVRVTAGVPEAEPARIQLAVGPDKGSGQWHSLLVKAPWMDAPIDLRYPESFATDKLHFLDHNPAGTDVPAQSKDWAKVWNTDSGGGFWFEWSEAGRVLGGRVSPNEDDCDLMLWCQNHGAGGTLPVYSQVCPVLTGTLFDDRDLERTYLHMGGKWVKMADTDRGAGRWELCHYALEGGPPVQQVGEWGASSALADAPVVAVVSEDGKYVFGIAWQNPGSILSNALIPCVHADPVWPQTPQGRAAVVRGKLYLMEGSLDDLLARVRREITSNK